MTLDREAHRAEPRPPDVWTVVVNWRQPEATCACLATLVTSVDPRTVILVDNESEEGFGDVVRKRFPQIVFLPQPINRGFAAAVNIGARHALAKGASAVFLLNNDAVVAPDAVKELVARLAESPRLGIVTAKVFLTDAPDRLWAVGGEFTGRRVISLGAGERDTGAYDARPLDFAYGCALMLKGEMLREIGLLDERFFLYYEDIDLCLRARAAGYGIAMAPRAHVWHDGSRSTSARPEVRSYHHARSRLLFFRRHVPRRRRAVFAMSETLYIARRLVEQAAAGKPWHALAYLRGTRDGWKLAAQSTERMASIAGAMAPLHSADWRFLVPPPPGGRFRHLALVGAGAGVAERVDALCVAERVTRDLPVGPAADLVVAFHRTPMAIERMAGAVAPDGVLYLEIDRLGRGWRASAPAIVRRTLERAGFSAITMYAADPDLDDPRVFLPFDLPAGRAWYGRTGFGETTTRQWARERFRLLAEAVLGRRAVGLLRHYVVVALAGGRAPSAPSVLADERVARLVRAPSAALPRLVPIVLGHGDDRVVMLPFAENGAQPLAVVKVSRAPALGEATEREHARMTQLRSHVDAVLAHAIPEPRGVVRTSSVTVAVESCLSGRSLANAGGSRALPLHRKVTDLRLAMDWLIQFHRQTETERVAWDGVPHRMLIEEPFRAYEAAFGVNAEEARLFAMAGDRSRALKDVTVPIVWQHRDYTVRNIARDGDHVAVLDWEGAREGPALCDALHLATSWLQVVRYSRVADGEFKAVQELFLAESPPTAAALAATRNLSSYLSALTIDGRLRPLLLTYHRVELALRRHDQQRRHGDVGGDARIGNVYVPVVTLLAKHAERLFADRKS